MPSALISLRNFQVPNSENGSFEERVNVSAK
jgi:hypothetical protein